MVQLKKRPPSSLDRVLKPWWNRPLVGELSQWERIRRWFYREEIPSPVVEIHNSAFDVGVRVFHRAESIEVDKFGSKEFLAFVRIKYALAQNKTTHRNLEKYAQLGSISTLRRVNILNNKGSKKAILKRSSCL